MAPSIEWLAGLLEGEGCFGDNGRNLPTVRLGMSDGDVVRAAADAFPGATPVKQRTVACANCKDVYLTSWSGKNAASLMWAVLPFVGQRRSDRILSILADWLEHRMAVCVTCGREFSRGHWRENVCSESCNRGKRNANQNRRYAERVNVS